MDKVHGFMRSNSRVPPGYVTCRLLIKTKGIVNAIWVQRKKVRSRVTSVQVIAYRITIAESGEISSWMDPRNL